MSIPRLLIIRWGDISHMSNVVTTVNYLADNGFDITLILASAVGKRAELLSNDVKLISLNIAKVSGLEKIFFLLKAARELRKFISNIHPDIIYVIDSWTVPLYWIANGFRYKRKKTVLVYHTYDWLEPGLHRKIHIFFERGICKNSSLVINTDRARGRISKTLYHLEKVPLWIPNYMSLSTVVPIRSDELRMKLIGDGAIEDVKLLIYPVAAGGDESFERMTLELIKAFNFLPENYRLITFYKEGSYYQKCVHQIAVDSLSKRVKFLSPIPFAEMLNYLACADLGAILYDDRLSSGYFMCNPDKLSIFTTLGIPFVASDYPNLESIVYRYGLGECCDSHDPRQIADAIRNIAEGAPGFEVRRKRMKEVFSTQMNLEKHGTRLATALHGLLG